MHINSFEDKTFGPRVETTACILRRKKHTMVSSSDKYIGTIMEWDLPTKRDL